MDIEAVHIVFTMPMVWPIENSYHNNVNNLMKEY